MSHAGVKSQDVAQDSPLRRWRLKHGFTQAWIAKRCGVSVYAVTRWENGRRVPMGETLLCLMELTGIPAEGLIRPRRYLEEHSTYLAAWASKPQRGRPRKRPPEGEGPNA
jgi:transcriptional regulator with XRE-family HTH domain